MRPSPTVAAGPDQTAEQVASALEAFLAEHPRAVVLEDGKSSRVLFQSPDGKDSIEGISVSPNGQYAVVEETLDTVNSVSDGYLRNARSRNIATVVVDMSTGRVVRTLDGFAVSWQ